MEVESPTVSSSIISNAGSNESYEINLEQMFQDAEHENETISVPMQGVRDSVEFFNNVKVIFHSDSCTRAQKIQILTFVPETWSTADTTKHFDTNWRLPEAARKCWMKVEYWQHPLQRKVFFNYSLLINFFLFIVQITIIKKSYMFLNITFLTSA